MAIHDPVNLKPLSRRDIGGVASRLPKPHAGLGIRIVEPLRVLSLRCLPGGAQALTVAAGELPGPGRFIGTDPLLLWRSPSEWVHIRLQDAPADALLRALPVGSAGDLAHATDLSAGLLLVELESLELDALLPRLIDASVQVGQPGQATRTWLMDIAAVVIRVSEQRLWLLVDRANDHYLADWLAYAAEAAFLTSEA